MNNSRLSPWKSALLALGLLFVYFFGLGAHGLLEPDEGRYSEIPREMMETGDFVTPRLNYVKYFEKPVLHYWLTAASMKVFGESEFAGRFWPATLALSGTAAVWVAARRLHGARGALYSSAVLGAGLLYFAVGRINIIDMTLSFFMTLSFIGLWFAVRDGERARLAPVLLFHAGMALAVLSKGLVGVVLPVVVLGAYALVVRDSSPIRRALDWRGVALFFALTVPWFFEVCRRNPDFFHFFFVQEHFLRYATRMHGRYEPHWFFIPILLVGLIPWTGLLPGALASAFPRPLRNLGREKKDELFHLLWFGVIFVFFSLSSSKLVPYIVPALPPLAILMGGYLARCVEEEDVKRTGRFLLWNSILLVPFTAALVLYPFFNDREPAGLLLPYTLPVAAVLVMTVYLGWRLFLRRRYGALAAVMCLMSLLTMFSFGRAFLLYDRLLSARELAARIDAIRRPGDVVAQFADYDQGLPFYLKQRVVLADWLGELEFGAAQETDPSWFLDGAGLAGLWSGERRVILVMDADRREHAEERMGLALPDPSAETRDRLVFVNRR